MYIDYQWLVENGLIEGDKYNPETVNRQIMMIQRQIEYWTGRIFEPYLYANTFDGGPSKFFLPNPILEVKKLFVNKKSVEVIDNENFDGNPLHQPIVGHSFISIPIVATVTFETYKAIPNDFSIPFKHPDKVTVINRPRPNYAEDSYFIQFDEFLPDGESIGYIEAILGYLEQGKTPEAIIYVISELVAKKLKDPEGYKDQISGRGLIGEKTDGHEYRIDTSIARRLYTGDQELDDIIRTYKKQSPGISGGLV